MSRAQRFFRTAIPLVTVLSVFLIYGNRRFGGFRIDEPHKIAETYYLRLLERGDIHHRDWFTDQVERSNPVAGKYIFGAALQLAGRELPRDLTPAQATNEGQRKPPANVEREFEADLLPVRTVSLISTALTAALVAFIALRASGVAGSLLATLFFIANFLTQAFAGTAVFDPLLTLFVTATLSLITPIALDDDHRRRDYVLAAVAGILGAVAFQIRFTGAFAIIIFCIAMVVRSAIARRFRRGIAICFLAGSITLIAGTAMNPFYWSRPADPGIEAAVGGDHVLPLRIVARYRQQVTDLEAILRREQGRQRVLRAAAEKVNFVFQYACGDAMGILMLVGTLLSLLLVRDETPLERMTVAWSVALVVIFTAWLPIGFPRFVLLTVPALAITGGIGWATLVRGLAAMIRARRRTPTTA